MNKEQKYLVKFNEIWSDTYALILKNERKNILYFAITVELTSALVIVERMISINMFLYLSTKVPYLLHEARKIMDWLPFN